MKTIIAIALALSSTLANANEGTIFCGHTAELSVLATKASKEGMSWEKVGELSKLKIKPTDSDFKKITSKASNSVIEEAFYSWSMLPEQAVRSLAFNECKSQVRRAYR